MLLCGFLLLIPFGPAAEAQRIRLDGGGGWAFPTNNVETEVQGVGGDPVFQEIDLKAGPQVYVGAGLLRSLGEKFELGARLRAHVSELRSTVDCRFESTCGYPDGRLLAGTIEGRIILTSPGWIHPYLLVGLGVVHASVDGVTLRGVESSRLQDETVSFPDVSVVDAGGDVGLGASLPVAGGLYLDAEVRVTGSLPGGKKNAVTAVPLTLGVAYVFE